MGSEGNCFSNFSLSIILYRTKNDENIFNLLSNNCTKWSNSLKKFVGKSRQIVPVCLTILWVSTPSPTLKKTTPSFFPSSPLNRQTVQVPLFYATPPPSILVFLELHPPLKIRFFSEPPKY